MSQLKKVMSGLIFNKSRNKSFPKVYKSFLRKGQLEKGYKEMASLNLSLARKCIEADNDALSVCEEKLTECE